MFPATLSPWKHSSIVAGWEGVCVCTVCVCVWGSLSVGGSRLSVCRCTHHRETHISDVLHQAVTHVQLFLLFSHSARKRGRVTVYIHSVCFLLL